MLGPDDRLARRPRRVLLSGPAGAGKTTVGRRIAAVLDVPYVELDALFHGPGWVPRPTFEAEAYAAADRPAWVTEWAYGRLKEHLAARADLLVWLDLSRSRVMRQLVRRTVLRRWRRETLYNGNVEPPLRTVVTDPEHIFRLAWSSHEHKRDNVRRLHERRPELTIVRLRTRAEVNRWLAGLSRVPPG